jgi:hypothetical protein
MAQDQIDVISEIVDNLLDITDEQTQSINALNQTTIEHNSRLIVLENMANDDVEDVIKDYLEKNPPQAIGPQGPQGPQGEPGPQG